MQLDFRALSLNASESLIPLQTSWDPQSPKNLDDSQWEPCRFTKKGDELPSEPGFRETTYVLIRRQFSYLYRQITQTTISFETAQSLLIRFRTTTQTQYLRQFDPDHPLHTFVSALIHQQFTLLDIVSRQIQLSHTKPPGRSGSITSIHPTSAPKPNSFRHDLFHLCLAHLEETSRIENEYARYKWGWIVSDQVPWHAIARLLTDLCHWFEGLEVERAWRQIDLVWKRYGEPNNGGLVASPIFSPLRLMREQAEFRLQRYREGEIDIPFPLAPPRSEAEAEAEEDEGEAEDDDDDEEQTTASSSQQQHFSASASASGSTSHYSAPSLPSLNTMSLQQQHHSSSDIFGTSSMLDPSPLVSPDLIMSDPASSSFFEYWHQTPQQMPTGSSAESGEILSSIPSYGTTEYGGGARGEHEPGS